MIKDKWCLTCMDNANIKCRSLARRKKVAGGHIHVIHDMQTKMIVILTKKI